MAYATTSQQAGCTGSVMVSRNGFHNKEAHHVPFIVVFLALFEQPYPARPAAQLGVAIEKDAASSWSSSRAASRRPLAFPPGIFNGTNGANPRPG